MVIEIIIIKSYHCDCPLTLCRTPAPMTETLKSQLTSEETDPLLKKSTLYQEFLAEREEILRHKWLKSEEAGRDIGFESALVDWMINHRSQWKRDRTVR